MRGAGTARRKDKALVVSMDHGQDSDGAGCETPGVLVHQLALLLLVLKRNVEHLGEVLAEVVGSGTLNSAT